MQDERTIRVIVAKPGLDGHDRGAKIVARALRDAGMEVIYLGLRNTPARIVSAAIDEDVDVIGLSVLSGAHLSLTAKVLSELAASGASDIPVVVGGTIPSSDVQGLVDLGAAGVFSTGTELDVVVRAIRDLAAARQ
jgi:methylmalonyl-CoA mutase C-terminal domain/subunit